MTQAEMAISASIMMWILLAADMVVFGHGFDVLGVPMIAAALASVGAFWGMFGQSGSASYEFGATKISFARGGSRWFMVAATGLLMVSPRIGMPLLGFALAHFRGASLPLALTVGASIAVVMELLLVQVLGIALSLYPL